MTYHAWDEDGETMIDLGGGMVVPLSELLEDGWEEVPHGGSWDRIALERPAEAPSD